MLLLNFITLDRGYHIDSCRCTRENDFSVHRRNITLNDCGAGGQIRAVGWAFPLIVFELCIDCCGHHGLHLCCRFHNRTTQDLSWLKMVKWCLFWIFCGVSNLRNCLHGDLCHPWTAQTAMSLAVSSPHVQNRRCLSWTSWQSKNASSFTLLTLLRPLGRIWPKRIHLGIPLILPRRWCVWAGLHAALRHACIDFFTYLDDQGGLVYVRVGSSRFLAGEDMCGATDHFQRFWNDWGRKRVNQFSNSFFAPNLCKTARISRTCI